jgi:hypothetical protein
MNAELTSKDRFAEVNPGDPLYRLFVMKRGVVPC